MRSRQPRVVLPTGELRHLGGLRLTGDEASREVRFNDEATVAGRLVGAAGAWVGLSLLCFLASAGQVPWASLFSTSLEPALADTQAWLREGPAVRQAMVGARSVPPQHASRAATDSTEDEPASATRANALPQALNLPSVAGASAVQVGVGEIQPPVAGLPPVPNPRMDFGHFHSAGTRRVVEAPAPVQDWTLSDRPAPAGLPKTERPVSPEPKPVRLSEKQPLARLEPPRAPVPALAPVDDGSVAFGAGLGLSAAGNNAKFAPVPLDGSWGDLSQAARREPRLDPSAEAAAEPAIGVAPLPNVGRVSSGKSCEAAYAASVREVNIGKKSAPDVAPRQYANLLEKEPFSGCGVARAARIEICVAVQQGRAVGVTVNTTPGDAALSRCVASRVRSLSFPNSAELDVVRTTLTFSAR